VQDGNNAVVSVKVPKRIKEKMRSMEDVMWSEVLRKAIETKIREHERKEAVAGFLAFKAKNKTPKNRTADTSEVLVKKTREER
jgi:hypothetical protein